MGKIFVIGMGPGGLKDMSPRARKAIEVADLVVGYSAYLDLLQEHFLGKQFIKSGMTREVERCKLVLEKALEGHNVALVSSGDSGIYGMAGIMLEVVNKSGSNIDVEVIPGITAASAAAAVLGAPIMHDFAVISLSDLMTPWELISKRIEYAAQGDFVICLYNPKSKNRSGYINIARDIVMKYRDANTPVGIVKNVGRTGQTSVIATLENMLNNEIDMFTVVLIGNSQTYIEKGKMITPRGYRL
ncbi:precorrin-3B C(17)-methyltransferase [Lutispora thermophila]|uniref:Cobalt-precorrin 3 C17-methyltransferase n=1 Tax=Lutispora thermophila DSM 19022 TaxID=1122184 RepID=A0A1M6D3J7_9FIRM|nr:precorrin-3B C(17)-methyltransferase [Lutispora thermophila]SHI67830.1 cobalt-precorrin 3 C17-methyltransferase [Lutispora thermophila DSM 19022]